MPTWKPSVEIVNCPLCGSPHRKPFVDFLERDILITYLVCASCGLVFQSPRMSESEQSEFYAEHYRTHLFDQIEPPSFDVDIQIARAKHISNTVEKNCKDIEGKLHLDIGCGIGALISRIAKDHLTKGMGIEPDCAYRQYAKKQEIQAYPSLDEWSAEVGQQASLVTLSHVLEHLAEPADFLRTLREKYLLSDGYLFIEVPNLYFHQAFELAHNYAFSQKTLIDTLKKAGYSILFLKKHGTPLNKTPRYLTVIAQPSNNQSSEFIKTAPPFIGLRRRMGRAVSQTEDWYKRMLRRIKNRIKHL